MSWGVVALAGRRRANGGGVLRRRAMKFRVVCRPMEVRGTAASAAALHGGMEALEVLRGGAVDSM